MFICRNAEGVHATLSGC